MSPEEYQEKAWENVLDDKTHDLPYMILGLCNEAGEAAGKMKKVLRKDLTLDQARGAIKLELGDVLWYLSGGARLLGFTLSDVMESNIIKIQDRKARGVRRGDGDYR